MIGEEGEGIHIVENSEQMESVGFMAIPGNREFIVDGNTLYAESYYDVIKIDVTDPRQARIEERAAFSIQEERKDDKGNTLIGFDYAQKSIEITEEEDFYNDIIDDQLVYLDFARNSIPVSALPSSFAGTSGGQVGVGNKMAITGDHLYLISNDNMIAISTEDFTTGHQRHKGVMSDMETIFAYENMLFLGGRSSMNIFSPDGKNTPILLHEFQHATSCDPVLPFFDVAYVTLRTADFSECPGNTNALVVLNIEDPSRTYEVKELPMFSPYGMSISDDKLYVAEGKNGLKLFDISDKFSPELLNHFIEVEVYDVIQSPFSSSFLYLAGPDGLGKYETGENQELSIVGELRY